MVNTKLLGWSDACGKWEKGDGKPVEMNVKQDDQMENIGFRIYKQWINQHAFAWNEFIFHKAFQKFVVSSLDVASVICYMIFLYVCLVYFYESKK